MTPFVCIVPVCPVRAEPSHRSEQVSQLLFGELCELLEASKDFIKIRTLYDGYEGWCQQTQLLETVTVETDVTKTNLAAKWVNEILVNDCPMYIPFGSALPNAEIFGNKKISYNCARLDKGLGLNRDEQIKSISSIFINTPYLWGGRSVFGIDCSGFTQLVFKCMGVSLLRDASQQVMQGDEVGFIQESACGDLAFFDNEVGKITHVGILLDTKTIIHASGKVKIDSIDTLGIINRENGKRTHNLRAIKRVR